MKSFIRNLPWIWLGIWLITSLFALGADSAQHLEKILGDPTIAHPLGFDAFGRDALVILLRGALLSSVFALFAVFLTFALGLSGGLALAVAPPGWQIPGLRTLEFFLAFPSLIIALAWAAVRGPGWDTLMVALCIGTLPAFIRLIYVRARELLAHEFVLAARSLGATDTRVAVSHLFPALLSMSLVKLPGLFAYCLLAEATLSFLGIGAPIGRDTWGSLLVQAKDYLLEAPHLAIATGTPLVLTALSLQLISERKTESLFRV